MTRHGEAVTQEAVTQEAVMGASDHATAAGRRSAECRDVRDAPAAKDRRADSGWWCGVRWRQRDVPSVTTPGGEGRGGEVGARRGGPQRQRRVLRAARCASPLARLLARYVPARRAAQNSRSEARRTKSVLSHPAGLQPGKRGLWSSRRKCYAMVGRPRVLLLSEAETVSLLSCALLNRAGQIACLAAVATNTE